MACGGLADVEAYPNKATGSCGGALRINGLDRRFGLADLHALLESSARPDYLVLNGR
jgi:citrate lyase beta subunit